MVYFLNTIHIIWFVIYPVIIGVIATLINIAQYMDRDAVEIFLLEKARPYRGYLYYLIYISLLFTVGT